MGSIRTPNESKYETLSVLKSEIKKTKLIYGHINEND